MNSIVRAKKQWQMIVDAIPQLLCLVDKDGRILRVNRTLERWGLGDVSTVSGSSLHGTLHSGCTAADCYLLALEQKILNDLAHPERTQLEVFDPVLQRHLAIRFQPTLPEEAHPDMAEVLALVSIDDVSETKREEQRVSKMHVSMRHRILEETTRRLETESVQARLLNLLSKTPNFIAIAAADGTLIYLNQSARQMLQLDEDEDFRHFKIFEFLTPQARETMLEEALPVAVCAGTWNGSSELLGRRGRRISTNQVVIAHLNQDGKCDAYSIVEQDMTAWIQSEAALRRSQEEARLLTNQLLNVQEDERQRIAGDLHDVIGQSLSLIKLSIDNVTASLDKSTVAEAGNALQGLSAKVKDALVEVRRISMDLRPAMLDDLGILPTLSWFFREFESACPGIRLIKHIAVKENEIATSLKTTIFRLLQEATTNIVKHAGADRIEVALLRQDEVLMLSVTDNGKGFDPRRRLEDNRSGSGMGLTSMRERVRLSGGVFALDSAPARGTAIRVVWPDASGA